MQNVKKVLKHTQSSTIKSKGEQHMKQENDI